MKTTIIAFALLLVACPPAGFEPDAGGSASGGGAGGSAGGSGGGTGSRPAYCDAGLSIPRRCVDDGVRPDDWTIDLAQQEQSKAWSARAVLGFGPDFGRHCQVGDCEVEFVGSGGEGGGCGAQYCGRRVGKISVTVGAAPVPLTEVPAGYGYFYSATLLDSGWSGGEPISVTAQTDGGFIGLNFEGALTAPARAGPFSIPASVAFGAPLDVDWVPSAGPVVISAVTQDPFNTNASGGLWRATIRCTTSGDAGHFTIPAPILAELGTSGGIAVSLLRASSVYIDAGIPIRFRAETSSQFWTLTVTCP